MSDAQSDANEMSARWQRVPHPTTEQLSRPVDGRVMRLEHRLLIRWAGRLVVRRGRRF